MQILQTGYNAAYKMEYKLSQGTTQRKYARSEIL